VPSLQIAGNRKKTQQSQTAENSKAQTKTEPPKPNTIHQKTPKKIITNTKLQTKTPNNKEKGLLDCRVAVCCALKNIGPFFELDPPYSEEPASLKETRMKKTHQDTNKKEIAGEN
jgi:hypothetical protein